MSEVLDFIHSTTEKGTPMQQSLGFIAPSKFDMMELYLLLNSSSLLISW